MRENRTFGTVRGAPGNRRSYRGKKMNKGSLEKAKGLTA